MKKISVKSAKLKLWAIDVCPKDGVLGMTVILVASSLQRALLAAERRYPQRFSEGSRGHAIEADHAAFNWEEGTLDTVKVGAWWGQGYLNQKEEEDVKRSGQRRTTKGHRFRGRQR
jgi:hypothetical protein